RDRSRSPSPTRETPYKRAQKRRRRSSSPPPPRYTRNVSPHREQKRARMQNSSTTGQSFRHGAAAATPLSACTLCLGRNPHDIANCASETLWDGSQARCRRGGKNRLVNPSGTTICTDWQKPSGCHVTSHDSRHECS
ncbi:hypothetical protein BDZ97DRAFT_1638701, partial [Flammula alnicola]